MHPESLKQLADQHICELREQAAGQRRAKVSRRRQRAQR